MENDSLEALVKDYLRALEERNLSRCLDFYADDATIKFQTGVFHGKQAIEEWHKDRFNAELTVVKIEKVDVQGDRVVVDGTVTSNRLKAWKINRLSGRVTFLFENGNIKKTEFGVRIYNPLEGW